MRWLKYALLSLIAGLAIAFLALTFSGGRYAQEAEARFPPVGGFVSVDGLDIHYLDQGTGPAVVLIHGASGNLRDWTFSLVEKLAPNYRVIAFDRPGLGHSDRPETGGDDPRAQARILSDAAAALGADSPLIVGHSFGGAVAAAWAVERPGEIGGLLLISAATYDWGGGGGLLYNAGANAIVGPAVSSLARAMVTGERLVETLARIFAPNAAPPGYADHLGLELALRRENFRNNARDIVALAGHLAAQSARYGDITAPVILLHGEADVIVGPEVHSRRFAADLPGAELRLFPGVGHMLHQVEEAAVIQAIDDLTPKFD